jgi:hypothetical protein
MKPPFDGPGLGLSDGGLGFPIGCLVIENSSENVCQDFPFSEKVFFTFSAFSR